MRINGGSRDDGLGVVKATPRVIEMIKKDLCSILNHHGLKITIEANKKAVAKTKPTRAVVNPTSLGITRHLVKTSLQTSA